MIQSPLVPIETDNTDVEKAVDINTAISIDLDNVKSKTIFEQWDEDFNTLDESLQEIVWDLLNSHVTQFVKGHPLSQTLKSNILRVSILEIASQCRGLVGKAVSGLVSTGFIEVPIDNSNVQATKMTQEFILKLLHSHAG